MQVLIGGLNLEKVHFEIVHVTSVNNLAQSAQTQRDWKMSYHLSEQQSPVVVNLMRVEL